MNNEVFAELFYAVLTLVTVVIVRFIVPWIKSKADSQKLNTVIKYTELAERSAKELFANNDEKREYVLAWVEDKAHKLGISMDSAEIRLVLEGVYNLYKDSINNLKGE